MDLYEVERILHDQGVDLTNIEIRPALVINSEVVFIAKQGRNPRSLARDMRNKLNKDRDAQRSYSKNKRHA